MLASASSDSIVQFWNPTTEQWLQTLEDHTDSVKVITFSEDGKMLASASDDGTVWLWDPTTGPGWSKIPRIDSNIDSTYRHHLNKPLI